MARPLALRGLDMRVAARLRASSGPALAAPGGAGVTGQPDPAFSQEPPDPAVPGRGLGRPGAGAGGRPLRRGVCEEPGPEGLPAPHRGQAGGHRELRAPLGRPGERRPAPGPLGEHGERRQARAEPARWCASSSTSRSPGDEFSIATFAGGIFEVEVPVHHRTWGRCARRATRWVAYGTTTLHDAVARIPQISLEGRNPKRFALLITDGVDNASRLTPEQARAVVQEAQLPTYVLGLGSGNPYELTPGREEDLPLRRRAEPARRRHRRTLLLHLQPARISRRPWRTSSTMSGTNTYWVSRPGTGR